MWWRIDRWWGNHFCLRIIKNFRTRRLKLMGVRVMMLLILRLLVLLLLKLLVVVVMLMMMIQRVVGSLRW